MQELLSRLLGQVGFSTVKRDRREALAAARRVRPRLVLLDVHLPGVSGYGCAESSESGLVRSYRSCSFRGSGSSRSIGPRVCFSGRTIY